MHDVHGVVDLLALADVDGAEAVLAAAAGQGGVLGGAAAVERHGGEQAQDLAEHVLQVGAGLEVREGDVAGRVVRAEAVQHDGPQLLVRGRVARQRVARPAEQAGGRVAAREEDVEQLAAQLDRVARALDELGEEDVLLALAAGAGGFGGRFGEICGQCEVDVVVGELVDLLALRVELPRGVQVVHVAEAAALWLVGLLACGCGDGWVIYNGLDCQ